jgi:hypothetical protein
MWRSIEAHRSRPRISHGQWGVGTKISGILFLGRGTCWQVKMVMIRHNSTGLLFPIWQRDLSGFIELV